MGRLIPAGTGFSEYRLAGLTEDVVERRRPADILAGMAEAAAEADASVAGDILGGSSAD
jgi:hypothetical protein